MSAGLAFKYATQQCWARPSSSNHALYSADSSLTCKSCTVPPPHPAAAARAACSPTAYTVRIDFASNVTQRCGDFWAASAPRQSGPPATAVRGFVPKGCGRCGRCRGAAAPACYSPIQGRSIDNEKKRGQCCVTHMQYRGGVRAIYDEVLRKLEFFDAAMGAMSLRCNQPNPK